MVICNEITFEATVQWRSYIATARDTSSFIAKNTALEAAIKKGVRCGERYDIDIEGREWHVIKLARFGRGTTLNGTYTGQRP